MAREDFLKKFRGVTARINKVRAVTNPENDMDAVNYRTFKITALSYTTAERDALTPSAGQIILNTTTTKFQGYDGSSWQNLN